MPRSVPAIAKRPRANSMSTAEASSTWAAICLPCSITLSPASRKAWLATSADFEPPVPPPTLSWSESPCSRRKWGTGMPSLPPSTWANGVAWPWP